MKELARDNVYNNENDFNSQFTWTIYGDDSFDWLWDSKEQYIGICLHRGGDVRGNYGTPEFYRVGDAIAETGFIDWTVGWFCESGPDEGMVEKINEECSPGYSSSPTCHLCDLLETEDCEWVGGTAHVETEDGVYIVHPTYYGGDVGAEVLDLPADGSGWLHDVAIDTEAWLEAVLESGDAEKITETVCTFADVLGVDHPEWDNSEGVDKILKVMNCFDEYYGCDTATTIAKELESDISPELPEDVRKETEELHRKLVGLIERVAAGLEDFDPEEIEELVDQIG
jgi:hypothetical protein